MVKFKRKEAYLKNSKKYSRVLKAIAMLMLIIAVNELPYDYYTILRWVVCGISSYLAYKYYESNKNTWTWIFGVIAVIFNPILPVHLKKETWQIIDIGVAILFFISMWIEHSKVELTNKEGA